MYYTPRGQQMGKAKRSKHRVRERIQPTGLPSVEEAEGDEEMQEIVKGKTFPLFGKVRVEA